MKSYFKIAIAIAFIVATSATLAPRGQAQQIGDNSGSIVSQQHSPVFAAASKKKRSASSIRRSICDSFGGFGWTCRPAGKRTCCCHHSFFGQDCFGIE